uniref:Uncharacterized protein n=1 Tax=Rhizophora mucronata TaxID=61149 RepID=A0A2P2N3D2_RHIMU
MTHPSPIRKKKTTMCVTSYDGFEALHGLQFGSFVVI